MSEANAVGHASVQELVNQRDQLRGWIARLDQVGSQAAGHVAQRVRGDYEARLRQVTEALSTHGEEIERERTAAGTAVVDAEARRAEAGDRLEEQRLRHLIGELPEDAWEQARPELEGELSAAEDALVGARAELERLETLAAEVGAAATAPAPAEPAQPEPTRAESAAVTPETADVPETAESRERDARAAEAAEADAWEPQMDEAESASEPAAEAPPPSADAASADEWDPFGGEFGADTAAASGDAADELPWLDDLEAGSKAWDGTAAADTTADEAGGDGLEFLKSGHEDDTQPEPPAAPRADAGADLGDDDLAFLEELDRAISSSPAPAPPAAQPSAGGATPAPGGKGAKAEPLLCKECGAINEPHAWYCEICGSEL